MPISQTSKEELSRGEKELLLKQSLESARRNFADYCLYTDRNYELYPAIEILCDALQKVERGDIKKLMITMPPRHGKSETASRKFPAWYLGKHPEHNIILGSYSALLAKSFSRDVRDGIENVNYKTIFSTRTQDDARAVSDWNISGHKGGMLAVGVGGGATGFGADLFIIDDPVKNKEEAESTIYRERTYDWYRSVVKTRLEPNAAIVLIMTRWHKLDCAGRILEAEKDWTIINLEAICEHPEQDILGRKRGEALIPERYNEETLGELKTSVGSRVWYSLYQGNPRDPESQIIKREWIQWYREIPPVTRRAAGIDTATSAKTAADNFSMVDLVKDGQNFLYVDECYLGKASVTAFSKYVCSQCSIKRYLLIKIESNNAGEAVRQRIVEVSREDDYSVAHVPIRGEAAHQDKVVRVMDIQPLIENGTMKFRLGNPRIAALVEHLIEFDGKSSDIDDDIDALWWAWRALRGSEYSLADLNKEKNRYATTLVSAHDMEVF